MTTPVRAQPEPRAPKVRRPCTLDIPEWELALVAAQNHREMHGFDVPEMESAMAHAERVIDRLPASDPRYVEAHCRMALELQHASGETHWLLAIAALRERAPKGEARYRYLELPGMALATRWSAATLELQTAIHPEIMGVGPSGDMCRTPDLAMLEMGQAGIYSAAGKRGPGEPRRRERKPKGTKLLRAGSNHVAALMQDVEAELGPDHAYSATMREHLLMECDMQEHERFPKICRPDAEVRRDALAARMRELGDAHVLTRHSKLMVATDLLDATGLPEAKRLLGEVAAAEHDVVWVLAQQVLAGIAVHEGHGADAFDRLGTMMQEVPRIYEDQQWSHQQAWSIYGEVARAAGKSDVAEHARTQSQAVHDRWRWDGPGGPSVALARLYQDAGDLEKRDKVLEHQIHDDNVALGRPITPEARAWREADLATAKTCLAGE